LLEGNPQSKDPGSVCLEERNKSGERHGFTS
jgi:hypothetical protein